MRMAKESERVKKIGSQELRTGKANKKDTRSGGGEILRQAQQNKPVTKKKK